METSFDWTILSVADTTENNYCNRPPRIRSIERTILRGESCRSPRLQIKIRSKKKTYNVNMLKKYIARESEMDVVFKITRMTLL